MSSVGPTLYRGTVAPATGREGDIWMDLSTSPATPKTSTDDTPTWVDLITIPAPTEVNPFSWVHLVSNYTLTNTTNKQKFFNTTSNGALTLPTGVYWFDWLVLMDQMSTTSGNAEFDILGAGTATVNRIGYHTYGADTSSPENVIALSGAGVVTVNTRASSVTAATADGLHLTLQGVFRVSAEGTIIPSVALANGAASVLAVAGSYFVVKKIGESANTYVGAWT